MNIPENTIALWVYGILAERLAYTYLVARYHQKSERTNYTLASIKGNYPMFDSQKLAVFVPANTTVPIVSLVARGSAIVGPAGNGEAGQVSVDYEGNLYGTANIKTFADRARHAAGRQHVLYPTRTRSTVLRSELRQVGWFDSEVGIMLLDDKQAQDALASWLGVEVIEEKELHFSN